MGVEISIVLMPGFYPLAIPPQGGGDDVAGFTCGALTTAGTLKPD